MLVGHLPDLAELGSRLIGDNEDIGLELKKASLCRIAFDGKIRPAQGVLELLIPPAALRMLAKGNGGT
jgi:phosphohistidine phosphatase SixA